VTAALFVIKWNLIYVSSSLLGDVQY